MASLPLSAGTDLPEGTRTLTLDEVADRLGVSPGRVRTLIREHLLLAVSAEGQAVVPELFFDEHGIAKHYYGLVDVLLDGGFSRYEALRWLFRIHDDLGMHPAEALHTHSAREVIRRAQAEAF